MYLNVQIQQSLRVNNRIKKNTSELANLMKISLTLKNLKSTNTYTNERCLLKAHIGDYFKIQSAEEPIVNGICNFLQKNSIQIDKPLPQYVSFDLYVDGKRVARKSLFCNEAVNNQEVILPAQDKADKSIYKLTYQLSIVEVRKKQNGSTQQVLINRLKKRKTLDQDPDPTLDQRGHIKFLQLGKLTYSFAKRLDPLVKVYNKAKNILFWKAPEITILTGLFLSFFVFFPKISIVILCLFMIFGRNYITRGVQSIIPRQDLSLRLLPPQQNLKFLKDLMDMYCEVYENIFWILKEDDRTKIIAGIQIVCKLGILAIFILLFVSIQTLFVLLIWTLLFFTSDPGKRFLQFVLPQIVNSNHQIDKVIKNVSKSVLGKVFDESETHQQGLIKQLYIYEYQRWWVALNWKKQYYSNEDKTQRLHARMEPPLGWKWIDDWKYEVNENTDNEGFEYTNDFLKGKYTRYYKVIYHVVRRRKWYRNCIKVDKQEQIFRSAPPRMPAKSGISTKTAYKEQ